MQIDKFREFALSLQRRGYELEKDFLNMIWTEIKNFPDEYLQSIKKRIIANKAITSALFLEDFLPIEKEESHFKKKIEPTSSPWPKTNSLDNLLKKNNCSSLWELVQKEKNK